MHLNKAIDMADSQGLTFEAATSTENLLPVELTIHDHYGRETLIVLHKLPAIIGRRRGADVRLIGPVDQPQALRDRPDRKCLGGP